MLNSVRSLFPGQQRDEEIYLVIREHWFYLFIKLASWFLFVIVLFLIDHYAPIYTPNLVNGTGLPYFLLFKNVYTTYMILGLFMIWTLYYLNVQIITNQRIVDIDQQSLFSHRVSELDMAKIEDVTGETVGVFGTIFSFGNVYIQTAGTEEHFVFKNIPRPDKVEKLILDLYEQYHRLPNQAVQARIKTEDEEV